MPKSGQNRSESLCAGLWAPCRVFWVWFGLALGTIPARNRRFLAGLLKVFGSRLAQPSIPQGMNRRSSDVSAPAPPDLKRPGHGQLGTPNGDTQHPVFKIRFWRNQPSEATWCIKIWLGSHVVIHHWQLPLSRLKRIMQPRAGIEQNALSRFDKLAFASPLSAHSLCLKRPTILKHIPLPGPTRPRGGLGKAPAGAPLDLHRFSAR
jgi:hypothetical protein